MTNKYKPQGWVKDSYRHSLAAKGIPTTYNASKYAGLYDSNKDFAMSQDPELDSVMTVDDEWNDDRFVKSNPVKDEVTDIPAEIKIDLQDVSSFKLSDAAVLPGSLVKDAGSSIGDMFRFASEVTKK